MSNNDENDVFRLSLAEKPPISCSLVDDLLEPLHIRLCPSLIH